MTQNEIALKILNMGKDGYKDDAEGFEKLNKANKLIEEHVTEQLRLYAVVNSLTSKEAIDYEIYAKRKDKEENLKSWLYALVFCIMFFVGLFAILKSCSS